MPPIDRDDLLGRLGFVPLAAGDDTELRAARSPDQLLELLAARAARHLASEQAAGYRHFTVLHGQPESDLDTRRLERIAAAARSAGALLATRGGNDWTCWILSGRAAPITLLALERVAAEVGASWWRWTTDGTMPTMSGGTRHPKGPSS